MALNSDRVRCRTTLGLNPEQAHYLYVAVSKSEEFIQFDKYENCYLSKCHHAWKEHTKRGLWLPIFLTILFSKYILSLWVYCPLFGPCEYTRGALYYRNRTGLISNINFQHGLYQIITWYTYLLPAYDSSIGIGTIVMTSFCWAPLYTIYSFTYLAAELTPQAAVRCAS